jgi:hypothetical protein
VYVYDPSDPVVTVTMLVLHPNTNTIVLPLKPAPFAVSVPETVNDEPEDGLGGIAEAVSIVEIGSVSEPVLRFSVIVPGPSIETKTTLLEPEHDNPSEQVQLEIE